MKRGMWSVDVLESPPRSGFVPLKGVGGPTHAYDIVTAAAAAGIEEVACGAFYGNGALAAPKADRRMPGCGCWQISKEIRYGKPVGEYFEGVNDVRSGHVG